MVFAIANKDYVTFLEKYNCQCGKRSLCDMPTRVIFYVFSVYILWNAIGYISMQ